MNPQEARRAITQQLMAGVSSTPPLPGTIAAPRGYRCLVCNAGQDVADFVNRVLVAGATFAEAHRALGPINDARMANGQDPIGYQSVYRHGRDHLPAKSAAVREIVERRARAAQLDVDKGTTNIITVAAYAEAMMTKAFQEMASVDVSAAEGLAAAKFLNQLMAAERGNVGVEAAFAELGYIIEAVKESVPPQLFAKIVAKVEEKRGSMVIDASVVGEDFDPGEQPEEEFSPDDDGEDDF